MISTTRIKPNKSATSPAYVCFWVGRAQKSLTPLFRLMVPERARMRRMSDLGTSSVLALPQLQSEEVRIMQQHNQAGETPVTRTETIERARLDPTRHGSYWRLLKAPTASLMRCTDENPQVTSAAVLGYN